MVATAISKKAKKMTDDEFFDFCQSSEMHDKRIERTKTGKIIIMDNATFHKGKEIKELIEKRKCTLLYLPPYSPERNPIEHYWAVLKRAVKHFRKTISDITESIILSAICFKLGAI